MQLWARAYELAFNLRRRGVTIPYTDILTAACALHANAIILHADAHFDLISKHFELKVESLTREVRSLHQ
jgi:predicted nucleic acid-binding protein